MALATSRSSTKPVEPESLLLEVRKEKIDRVVEQRTRTFTVVLDRLEDSFNMAAVLRTCEAMGVQEVHVVINPDAPFLPNSRVAQGCDKWLDVKLYKSFAECREHLKGRGLRAVRLGHPRGRHEPLLAALRLEDRDRLRQRALRSERRGARAVDGTFWIPMRGFSQSINISAAASACISRAIAWREEHLGKVGDLTPEEAQALRERFYVLAVKQRKRIFKGKQP